MDLEPFFCSPKILRKSHLAEREGASTRAFGPQGRKLSGKSSERCKYKGGLSETPRGYMAKGACNASPPVAAPANFSEDVAWSQN